MPPAAAAAVEIARIDVAGGVRSCVFCEIGERRSCAVAVGTGLEVGEADVEK